MMRAQPRQTSNICDRARPRSFRVRTQVGFTLIELMIVVTIIGLASGVAVVSFNNITRAQMRSTAVELTGTVKFLYDRSIMESRLHRLGMDMDQGIWWIDYTEDSFALGRELDETDKGEKEAKPETSRYDDDDDLEVRKALEGGRAAAFKRDEEFGKPRRLPSDVKFSKIWTGHQEEPFVSGVAYVHFFKGGWTEPAQIELDQEGEQMTLTIAPLTGRVKIVEGPIEDIDVEEKNGSDEGDI